MEVPSNIHFGAGEILWKGYLPNYLPLIEAGKINLTVVSLEKERPTGLPQAVEYVSAEIFWKTIEGKRPSTKHLTHFDKAVVAVPAEQIAHVARQVLTGRIAQFVYLEKPSAVDQATEAILVALEQDYPRQLFCLSHYRRKPVVRKASQFIAEGLIGAVRKIEISILESKIISEREVVAHKAGILWCFSPHVLFSLVGLAGLDTFRLGLLPEFIFGGRYHGALLPDGVETSVMVAGRVLVPGYCPWPESFPIYAYLGKGLWDEKLIYVEGSRGFLIGDFTNHFLLLKNYLGTSFLPLTQQDDAYKLIVQDIFLGDSGVMVATTKEWFEAFATIAKANSILRDVTARVGLFEHKVGQQSSWQSTYQHYRRVYRQKNKILRPHGIARETF